MERQLRFNGQPATAQDLVTLAMLEQQWGQRVPDGEYWYDRVSGAAGHIGGPALGLLPPNLPLGGPLPANASGGGSGFITGVFVNGRELHPIDYAQLQQVLGAVYPGRWVVLANGDFGQEGGYVLGNLYALAQQRHGSAGGGGDSYYSRDQNGSVFVGGGMVAVTTKNGSYYNG